MKSNEIRALITGGVSGLGLAVAREVVALGGQAVLLDINDEAARMLLFEQMFKAMAKYLTTVQSSLSTVMDII